MADAKGWHSRGYLPHFDSPQTVQHVVLRTAASLPPDVIDGLPRDNILRRAAADAFLDRLGHGKELADPTVADALWAAMAYFDGTRYRLLAWCIMPNHLHAVFEQMAGWQLGGVIKSWKLSSTRAYHARHADGGLLWAPDYFDRFVRSDRQLANTIAYVEANPVRAGLVKDAKDWRHSSARLRI